MPSIKSTFSLKYDDYIKLQEKILETGPESENILNNYIHNQVAHQLIELITEEMPESKRGKRHAKKNIWYEQNNYNLSVNISNKTNGKKSYYYLYYVATGTGTSEKNGSNDFLERGLNKAYPLLINGIMDQLDKYFKEGLYE